MKQEGGLTLATTFQRLWTGLRRAQRMKSWVSLDDLRDDIRKQGHEDFKIGGNILSEESIARLLEFGLKLGLLDNSDEPAIKVAKATATALKSKKLFKTRVQFAVRSYLEEKGVGIESVHEAIRKIKFPDSPDAETIYKHAYKNSDVDEKIDPREFRKLLYLYSCADGIGRRVRVHYVGEG